MSSLRLFAASTHFSAFSVWLSRGTRDTSTDPYTKFIHQILPDPGMIREAQSSRPGASRRGNEAARKPTAENRAALPARGPHLYRLYPQSP